MTVVLSFMMLSRAACTARSLLVSKALCNHQVTLHNPLLLSGKFDSCNHASKKTQSPPQSKLKPLTASGYQKICKLTEKPVRHLRARLHLNRSNT